MTATACPGCALAPPPGAAALDDAQAPARILHLPDIHCAGCIRGVEEALAAVPGVQSARVNLSQKRVRVVAPGVPTEALIEALAGAGYRAQPLDAERLGRRDEAARDLLLRIGVAGFAMMNVMLLSVAVWSGAAEATARLFHLISAAIALPAVAYSGRPFFASALRALSAGRLNMDVPISLAIILAAGVSLVTALSGVQADGWFDAALALTFFLLVGRYLDQRGRAAARSAAAELAALEVPQALRLRPDGTSEVVATDRLAPGDLVLLRPGDRIPADGVIVEGETELDRSAITGESQPEPAGPGREVAAGETNLTGALTVRVQRAGAETGLARMAALVATAENQRSRHASLADRAARIYAPAVHLLGAGAFAGWGLATGDWWHALNVAISVLVITCPCALGLAVPAVSTVATARLFRRGLLVKSRTALERLSEVDTVIFDKTGTLTTGRPRLAGEADAGALALAAGLAAGSNHPAARALAEAAAARSIRPAPVEEIAERPGLGVEGRHAGRRVRMGRASWVGAPEDTATVWLDAGDGAAPVGFRLEESLREDAKEAIAALKAAGYRLALLSGDTPEAVGRVAAELGIDAWHARATPESKVAFVQEMQAQGARAVMVGDGLNDTGCLAVAHAAIAPGTALDAARSAADVVLLSGRLSVVPAALATARAALSRMRQNIALAVLYNIVSVPVALAGLASPLLAAIAMSSSSLTVTANALRPER